MKQKRNFIYLLFIIIVILLVRITTEAQTIYEGAESNQQETEQQLQDKVIEHGMGLFDWQEIEQAEAELRGALPEGSNFSLKEAMQEMLAGKSQFTVQGILGYIIKVLVGEIGTFIQFGGRFILIVLLCNLLQALSSSFKSKDTTKIGFFVCYLVILLSVVQSFQVMTDLALQVIEDLGRVMLVCVPALLAFMASTGFTLSAGAMAPVILTSLSLMTEVIKTLVMPCIVLVVVLEVMSAMSEEFKVDKWIALFYKGIKWTLSTLMVVSVGLLGMYRLVMPGVDVTVKKATVKFSTAFIPVIGSAAGGAIDFITQGASLIKNTFSAGVVIWLLIILSLPLIKIMAYVCIYQIAGAMIEPLGDKKMANIATKLGKGSQFIMSCVGIVALFCLCSLIICMTISSNGV